MNTLRFTPIGGARRKLVEEIGDRNVQEPGQVVKPAGGQAVGAFLVLLDLLEAETEAVGELLLRRAQQDPAQPHLSADMDVDRVRSVPRSAPAHGLSRFKGTGRLSAIAVI